MIPFLFSIVFLLGAAVGAAAMEARVWFYWSLYRSHLDAEERLRKKADQIEKEIAELRQIAFDNGDWWKMPS